MRPGDWISLAGVAVTAIGFSVAIRELNPYRACAGSRAGEPASEPDRDESATACLSFAASASAQGGQDGSHGVQQDPLDERVNVRLSAQERSCGGRSKPGGRRSNISAYRADCRARTGGRRWRSRRSRGLGLPNGRSGIWRRWFSRNEAMIGRRNW
jgi:hypothetical protein